MDGPEHGSDIPQTARAHCRTIGRRNEVAYTRAARWAAPRRRSRRTRFQSLCLVDHTTSVTTWTTPMPSVAHAAQAGAFDRRQSASDTNGATFDAIAPA